MSGFVCAEPFQFDLLSPVISKGCSHPSTGGAGEHLREGTFTPLLGRQWEGTGLWLCLLLLNCLQLKVAYLGVEYSDPHPASYPKDKLCSLKN